MCFASEDDVNSLSTSLLSFSFHLSLPLSLPLCQVHTFYAYWQSFSTCKSFAWEDTHNLRQVNCFT